MNKIRKPRHYSGGVDVLDLLVGMGGEHNSLESFCAGNVLKYVFRAGRKSTEDVSEDLLKASEYLELLRASKHVRLVMKIEPEEYRRLRARQILEIFTKDKNVRDKARRKIQNSGQQKSKHQEDERKNKRGLKKGSRQA